MSEFNCDLDINEHLLELEIDINMKKRDEQIRKDQHKKTLEMVRREFCNAGLEHEDTGEKQICKEGLIKSRYEELRCENCEKIDKLEAKP